MDPYDMLNAVAVWLAGRTATAPGADLPPAKALVYLTGHGLLAKNGEKVSVACRKYDPGVLLNEGTVTPAQFVEKFVENAVGVVDEILLVLDFCMSGQGVTATMEQALREWVLKGEKLKLWVVGSTHGVDPAEQLEFVTAFVGAVDEAPDSAEHIGIPWLREKIKAGGHSVEAMPTAEAGDGEVLPNPAHMPAEGPTWLTGEWERWSAPARGLASGERTGWFFTGRDDAMAAVTAVLDADGSDRRPRLVTGRPGSGKSALLGRVAIAGVAGGELPLIARSGPLPPPGSVHAALRLRDQWSVRDIARRLGEQLGIEVNRPAALLDALARRDSPVGVVLDDIDRCAQPAELVGELVRPLTAIPSVRLVMSSRAPWVPGLEDVHVVDLDHRYRAGNDELARYLFTRVTRARGAPLANHDARHSAQRLAEALAPQCLATFGIAAEVAKGLVTPGAHQRWPSDPLASGRKRVTEVVLDLFVDVLSSLGGAARSLVNPLRLWPREWLPESLWLQLSALSGTGGEPTSADVGRAAAAVPSLLVSREVDGEVWWRLRNEPPELDWPSDEVVGLLLAAVPEEGGEKCWDRAHPHLIRLLVRWITAPGCTELRTLLRSGGFIVSVPPTGATTDFATYDEELRIRTTVWRAVHAGAMDLPTRRLLADLLLAWAGLPRHGTATSARASLDWAVPLAAESAVVTTIAVHGNVMATAHDDASVRLWVSADPEPPRVGAIERYRMLAGAVAVPRSGRRTVAVGWRDGRVSLLSDDGCVELLGRRGRLRADSLVFATDTTVAFLNEGRLWAVDVDTAEERLTWAPTTRRLDRVAAGPTTGPPSLVVCTRSGDVLVRDAVRDTTIGVLHRMGDAVTALAVSPSGRTVVVLGATGNLFVHGEGSSLRLHRTVRHPVRVAVSDRLLCVAEIGTPSTLVVHSLADLEAPVLDLMLPEEPAAVAFRDDDSLVLSVVGGLAQITFLGDKEGSDE
uniref:NACHT and WD repeat domain-containing protein n=1 Tax=Saccharothrix mutabilis TaxID=33921 RepID=UPI0031DD9D4A